MFSTLGKILEQKSSANPMLRGVNAAMIVEIANKALTEIFGKGIVDTAQAVFLRQETLTIACLSSTAAQEIKLHEAELVDRIHKETVSPVVKKVRYIMN
jgi:hypothetical protein